MGEALRKKKTLLGKLVSVLCKMDLLNIVFRSFRIIAIILNFSTEVKGLMMMMMMMMMMIFNRNPWRWARFCPREKEKFRSTLISLITLWDCLECLQVMCLPQKVSIVTEGVKADLITCIDFLAILKLKFHALIFFM